MNEYLKLGDVVVLNSGGKNMTVTQISCGTDPSKVVIECSWFEGSLGDQVERHSNFPIEALKKVPQKTTQATIPPEIKEALKKIKSILPSDRKIGLSVLISLKAEGELAKLLGNKSAEVRELAAIGLAELRYVPALPQLIDGLNVIEGKNTRDLIPNVENLLASFGEAALKQMITKLPEKGLPRLRKSRWVTALANVISDENLANDLLRHHHNVFKQLVKKRLQEPTDRHRLSWMTDDPLSTPFEVILEAVIASNNTLEPNLLIEAATAYVTYNHHKIRRRCEFLKWLAKSNSNQSQQVIEMVGKWASNAIQSYEHEISEFGNSEDCVHDVIALLEAAIELNAVSHDQVDEYGKKARSSDLIKQLEGMRAKRITDC
jgi:uncharacterized protein YodC (DUF2158 family)